MGDCDYRENSIEPCKTCPRVITALHRCKFLQETKKMCTMIKFDKNDE